VQAGLLGPAGEQQRGRLPAAVGWAAGRLQAGEQVVAVAPGGLGPGGVPAGQRPLRLAGGGGQAEDEQRRLARLVAAAGERRQPLVDGRGRLVVVAIPQRQLGPGAGLLVGELGVELGAAGPGGQLLGLLEPAARGGDVPTSDVQHRPVQPGVHLEGTGAQVSLPDEAPVAVGVLPVSEQELQPPGGPGEAELPLRAA
jgi:hypothetical protein